MTCMSLEVARRSRYIAFFSGYLTYQCSPNYTRPHHGGRSESGVANSYSNPKRLARPNLTMLSTRHDRTAEQHMQSSGFLIALVFSKSSSCDWRQQALVAEPRGEVQSLLL